MCWNKISCKIPSVLVLLLVVQISQSIFVLIYVPLLLPITCFVSPLSTDFYSPFLYVAPTSQSIIYPCYFFWLCFHLSLPLDRFNSAHVEGFVFLFCFLRKKEPLKPRGQLRDLLNDLNVAVYILNLNTEKQDHEMISYTSLVLGSFMDYHVHNYRWSLGSYEWQKSLVVARCCCAAGDRNAHLGNFNCFGGALFNNAHLQKSKTKEFTTPSFLITISFWADIFYGLFL